MITPDGKRICDKEIRDRSKPGRHWKGCRKPAKIRERSKRVAYLELDFCCEAHRDAYRAAP